MCASDFPTLPRVFVQTLNMIKHFIVNLRYMIKSVAAIVFYSAPAESTNAK